ILIEEAVTQRERRKIERSARWFPGKWIAQRRFVSEPLVAEDMSGSRARDRRGEGDEPHQSGEPPVLTRVPVRLPSTDRQDEPHEQLPPGEPSLSKDGSGKYHVCIGVFTVDGRCAGFYGRISPYARIDHRAIDIPVLVAKEGEEHVR
ncbi:hypothetical protein PA598K_06580, partial [Paenibacillus sp. 598K]